MTGLSDRSAFEAFDRMTQRIEQTERLALASAEVTEELGTDHLEVEFKRLEVSDNADARLIELKRQMGLLPPAPDTRATALPNGEAQRQIGAGTTSHVQDAELIEEFEELEREKGAS
jgi:phage shock protein A